MQQFTIRDIEILCGIKAHTLRVWEQRYEFLSPKRKLSNHRIYDNEDLKELLQITYLYHHGYKISNIAKMNNGEIRDAVLSFNTHSENQTFIINQLMEATLDFNQEGFEKIITDIILTRGIEKTVTGIFYPFLERMGRLWVTNHAIPAQEHFASNIIQRKIINAIDDIKRPLYKSNKTSIVLFTTPGENHEIPLLLAEYCFKKNGIHTIYMGTNVCGENLVEYAEQFAITHFYTHVTTLLPVERLYNFLTTLHQKTPDAKIIIAGAPCDMSIRNLYFLKFLHHYDELLPFIKSL